MAELTKTIVECLGGDYAEHCEDLSLQLVCVSQSVKPAFMWEYPSVPAATLQSLLSALGARGLITEHVVMVSVEADVFVLNLDAVTRNLIGYLTTAHPWLVDISVTEPKVSSTDVHTLYKQFIRSILQQLGITKTEASTTTSPDPSENPSSERSNETTPETVRTSGMSTNRTVLKDPLVLKFPQSTNLSTVYGLLLGNPQVYWWDSDTSDGSNLSGLPLKVYQLNATCAVLPDDDNVLELFSFSVPEVLEATLRPAMTAWGNIAHTRVEQSQCFSNAAFSCDQMLCLNVAV